MIIITKSCPKDGKNTDYVPSPQAVVGYHRPPEGENLSIKKEISRASADNLG